ncbi:MAG: hypothetical protein ACOY0T_24100 [Myxococcota bacterium]
MRQRAYRWLVGLAAWTSTLVPTSVHAADCSPANGVSPCLDANDLWLTTGDARLFSLPSGEALPAGRVGLAIAVQALWRPLRLNVASSNATGRDISLVSRAVQQDTVLAIGLGKQLELGLGVPLVLHQTGAGSEGLTSQRGAPLDPNGARDPRVSLAFSVATGPVKWKPRVTLALPLGDAEAYASAGRVIVAPAVPVVFRSGRFEQALELGLRLTSSIELASVRMGSQASIGVGTSFEILEKQLLLVGAEAWLLPSLIDNQSARARAFDVTTNLLSAEYLFSLRSKPLAGEPWSVALGAGSSLALSRESSSAGPEYFVAPPGPSLRMLAEVRYAPR